ncbi:hypothetical protein OIU74_029435 [Salix koriyanagi]|uniref:Uncharacterized protein n=1 Tax=Salix koriyanagi TaxID=2511006 RepID=A0A9Q0ZUG5_9ROSI|nr:hypothetical protein OIU74_029435 [Salix koriyanagi]
MRCMIHGHPSDRLGLFREPGSDEPSKFASGSCRNDEFVSKDEKARNRNSKLLHMILVPVPTFESYMQQIANPPGAADTEVVRNLPEAKSVAEAEADKVPWKEKKRKSKSENV